MMLHARKFVLIRWAIFTRSQFGSLLRVFIGRVFQGEHEATGNEIGMGIAVIVILLAMPGVLASLLMFEKYGSLIRFLRGDGVFDPFTATLPDEYFFIVLSMFVTGAAALWRWDSFFLDRRDYMNLVPLPISMRSIFAANLCAGFALAGLFAVVANAASIVFFPVAVLGSQDSFSLLIRFAAGHAVAVLVASTFSFCFVLAMAGLLLTLFPVAMFRRVSAVARFVMAMGLFALLASSFTVPQYLSGAFIARHYRAALWPPLSFLGLLQTVWGRGGQALVVEMTEAAMGALGLAVLIATVTYISSFRRAFTRIAESPDAGPLPRVIFSFWRLPLMSRMFSKPAEQACYQFVGTTILRSDSHLQIVSGFMAIGIVAAANVLSSAPNLREIVSGSSPTFQFLSVPLILAYCLVIGVRFAFDIPADLRANWIFRFRLEHGWHEARKITRGILLFFSLSWLVPLCFLFTLVFWGWMAALLHTVLLVLCTVVLIELSLFNFRKIPFTCSYPAFKSHSGVVALIYLFGFLVFTHYVGQLEYWSLAYPWRALWFVPLCLSVLIVLHVHRERQLDMDKTLIFEDAPTSTF